jgi:hypothetical protein
MDICAYVHIIFAKTTEKIKHYKMTEKIKRHGKKRNKAFKEKFGIVLCAIDNPFHYPDITIPQTKICQ